MFSFRWSNDARRQYDELKKASDKSAQTRGQTGKSKSSGQEGLFRQILKSLGLLSQNPRHPGLKSHKYTTIKDPSGRHRDLWESYAQNDTPGAYRIFWCYGPGKGEITIEAIVPHPD
jgi:hypothetical protein